MPEPATAQQPEATDVANSTATEPVASAQPPAPAPAPAPAQPPKPPEEEQRFTQSQVNAIVQDRLRREREAASKQTAPAQPTKEPQPQPSSESKPDPKSTDDGDLRAEFAKLKADLAFTTMLSRMGFVLSDEDTEVLRQMYDVNPDAVPGLAQRLGGKPGGSAPAAPAPASPPVPTSAGDSPVSDKKPEPTYQSPGGTSSPPEILDTDATKWSAEYIARLRQEGTFMEELEKYRATLPGGGLSVFGRKRPPKR